VPMPISSTMRFFVIVLPSAGHSDAGYQGGPDGTPPFLHDSHRRDGIFWPERRLGDRLARLPQ
jgi:hypothetical protein